MQMLSNAVAASSRFLTLVACKRSDRLAAIKVHSHRPRERLSAMLATVGINTIQIQKRCSREAVKGYMLISTANRIVASMSMVRTSAVETALPSHEGRRFPAFRSEEHTSELQS